MDQAAWGDNEVSVPGGVQGAGRHPPPQSPLREVPALGVVPLNTQ